MVYILRVEVQHFVWTCLVNWCTFCFGSVVAHGIIQRIDISIEELKLRVGILCDKPIFIFSVIQRKEACKIIVSLDAKFMHVNLICDVMRCLLQLTPLKITNY